MNTKTKILDLARWRLLLATMTGVVSVVEKRVGGKKKKKKRHFSWSDPLIHINIHIVRMSYNFLSPPQTFFALRYKNHMVVLEIIIPLLYVPLCTFLEHVVYTLMTGVQQNRAIISLLIHFSFPLLTRLPSSYLSFFIVFYFLSPFSNTQK